VFLFLLAQPAEEDEDDTTEETKITLLSLACCSETLLPSPEAIILVGKLCIRLLELSLLETTVVEFVVTLLLPWTLELASLSCLFFSMVMYNHTTESGVQQDFNLVLG
jgi:hypothetical protein